MPTATTPVDIFEKLMALGPPTAVTASGALKRIGFLIDLAGDIDKEEGTARALEWCDGSSRTKIDETAVRAARIFPSQCLGYNPLHCLMTEPDNALLTIC
jgi:hypothetical protein